MRKAVWRKQNLADGQNMLKVGKKAEEAAWDKETGITRYMLLFR